jgi:hypothetical protein
MGQHVLVKPLNRKFHENSFSFPLAATDRMRNKYGETCTETTTLFTLTVPKRINYYSSVVELHRNINNISQCKI